MKVAVTVKPGSKKGPLVEQANDGSLTVYVRERAIEGAANAAVIKLLAAHYGVAKSRITLVAGGKAKRKLIEVEP